MLLRARIAAGLNKRRIHELEQARVRDVFARFLPESMVDQVLVNGDVRLGGVRLVGTALFTDLRGFTTFAESTPPDRVIDVLNRFFGEMSDAVLDNGGTLVAYLGDGLLAVFGAPVESDDHADRALRAAREMLHERLPRFNQWLLETSGRQAFAVGIGVCERPADVGQRRLGAAARVHGGRRHREHRVAARVADQGRAARAADLRLDGAAAHRRTASNSCSWTRSRCAAATTPTQLWTLPGGTGR